MEFPGEPQKAVVQSRYPHMGWWDAKVWRAFVERYGERLGEVWYDVKVGRAIEVGPEASAVERRLAEGTGCKRIDVVARVGSALWVVEVKPYGNYVALGQLSVYVRLFGERYGVDLGAEGALVCGVADPDCLGEIEARGFHLVEVGAIA